MELLTLVVFALLQAKDVRHAELAERFLGSAQPSSVICRIERFFNRHPLCQADVARVMLNLLPDKRPHEFILDRTNWKYRNTNINVLRLAVLWRGVAIPLLFELLPHGGSDDTDTTVRRALMDDALCLLEPADIQVLYADREFIGHMWIQGLACRGIPICVRLRLDTVVDEVPARDWLQDRLPGNTGIWVEQVDVYGQPMNITLTHPGR